MSLEIKNKADHRKKGLIKESISWLLTILLSLVIYVAISSFIYTPTIVSGVSMMPNYHNGDHFAANRFIYRFINPKSGDVVSLHANETTDYIKRIIAGPGETVQIKNDTVYVNGKALYEPYTQQYKLIAHKQGRFLTDDFGPVRVPENHYFVMGDNRQNSKDSRMIGPINRSQIIGRCDFVFWHNN